MKPSADPMPRDLQIGSWFPTRCKEMEEQVLPERCNPSRQTKPQQSAPLPLPLPASSHPRAEKRSRPLRSSESCPVIGRATLHPNRLIFKNVLISAPNSLSLQVSIGPEMLGT